MRVFVFFLAGGFGVAMRVVLPVLAADFAVLFAWVVITYLLLFPIWQQPTVNGRRIPANS